MPKIVIINESQLPLIKEYEDSKVLHNEFENKVRLYMKELFSNPCKPKYNEFFVKHKIPQDVLQDKMIDLGIIKKSENFKEPTKSNGKKHSRHYVKYIFSSDGFNDKIDKLYDTFFSKNGERLLTETDCSSCGGSADCSSDGATNAEGVGGQYTVPFGGVMRRGIGVSGNTVASMDKESNFDTKAPLKRDTKNGISVSVVK